MLSSRWLWLWLFSCSCRYSRIFWPSGWLQVSVRVFYCWQLNLWLERGNYRWCRWSCLEVRLLVEMWWNLSWMKMRLNYLHSQCCSPGWWESCRCSKDYWVCWYGSCMLEMKISSSHFGCFEANNPHPLWFLSVLLRGWYGLGSQWPVYQPMYWQWREW